MRRPSDGAGVDLERLRDTRGKPRRLRANVEALEIAHAGSGVCKHVTISVGGAATVPQRDDELLALIEVPDQALYEAKHAGRNRVVTRSK